MKHLKSLLALSLLGLPHLASAQVYPLSNAQATIDIANIKANHMVHGDMWYDNTAVVAAVEFPKGSGKTIAFLSSVWMAAHDPSNNLRTAAQAYREGGHTDYWPGPIDSLASTVAQKHAASTPWEKIWKINSKSIDTFLLLSAHTLANTPTVILEWPAKGNPYAKGKSGAALTITRDMAPFVDVNSDGVYNPLAGDYPKMKGSQMLWWIFNDATDAHTVTFSNPLNMEIRMSAYAYKAGTILDNIIFYEYEVTNRSTDIYSNYRLGIGTDFDLGQAFDDLAGYDSVHRLAIAYNSGSTTVPSAIAGCAWLEQPGDAYNSYAPLGSYRMFENMISPDGDPKDSIEYYYLLNSRNRIGQPYPGGSPYGAVNEREECDSAISAGDRRSVTASKDYTFQPGQTMKFATALVAADSANSCPGVDFTLLHQTADTAFEVYWNPRKMTIDPPTSVVNAQKQPTLRMFPNPATDRLFVEPAEQTGNNPIVYDAMGRLVAVPQTRTGSGFELNVSLLPSGVYSIRQQNNVGVSTGVFVKK